MSDTLYRFVCAICRPPLWLTSRPLALHTDRVPIQGALILAPNHTSPFDIPCLIRSTPRCVDFLSIVEMKRKPIVGPLYQAMNCVFVDRDRMDIAAARELRSRLSHGRAIAIFPEGHIRPPGRPVTEGGPFKRGLLKLAHQSSAPIVPCVMINTAAHQRALNWLPFQRWSYGIIFGTPIVVTDIASATIKLAAAYRDLFIELQSAIKADTSGR